MKINRSKISFKVFEVEEMDVEHFAHLKNDTRGKLCIEEELHNQHSHGELEATDIQEVCLEEYNVCQIASDKDQGWPVENIVLALGYK